MTRKEIKKLDALWALAVKEKAQYKCEHCGRYDSRMEAAHVAGRRYRATRWGTVIPRNGYDLCGHCLCHVCHQQYDEHGPLEPEIVQRTIKVMRKALIQREATRQVTKGQVFEDIKARLERIREGFDNSPYATKKSEPPEGDSLLLG